MSVASRTIQAHALVLAGALVCACRRAPELSFAAARASAAIGSGSVDAVLLDSDRDGILDVVVADNLGAELSLLRGDGHGGFAPARVIQRGTPLHAIVPADLDRDGVLDLVATEHDSHAVTVLLGDGVGGFVARGGPYPARMDGKPHNHGLVVEDFDEDGSLDVLTSNQSEGELALLLGDGHGGLTIAAGSPWAVGASPYPPVAADVDRDGHLEVVSPLVDAASIVVLRGDGHGDFASPTQTTGLRARPYSLAVGDIDEDGDIDAVVAHDDASVFSSLHGDGHGGFELAGERDLAGRGYDLVLLDVDGDGHLDLVGACYPSGIALLLGDGRGELAHAPGSPFPVGEGPIGVVVGDLDGDRRLDLATSAAQAGQLFVVLRRG